MPLILNLLFTARGSRCGPCSWPARRRRDAAYAVGLARKAETGRRWPGHTAAVKPGVLAEGDGRDATATSGTSVCGLRPRDRAS